MSDNWAMPDLVIDDGTGGTQAVPVEFDSRNGVFVALLGERRFSAYSWDDLRVRITVEVRKARVKIAVAFVDGRGKRGTITGIHAGNGNPLIRWEHGGAEQISDRVHTVLAADTDTAELVRLRLARDDAEKAYNAFVRAHRHPLGSGYHEIARREIERIRREQNERTEKEG